MSKKLRKNVVKLSK